MKTRALAFARPTLAGGRPIFRASVVRCHERAVEGHPTYLRRRATPNPDRHRPRLTRPPRPARALRLSRPPHRTAGQRRRREPRHSGHLPRRTTRFARHRPLRPGTRSHPKTLRRVVSTTSIRCSRAPRPQRRRRRAPRATCAVGRSAAPPPGAVDGNRDSRLAEIAHRLDRSVEASAHAPEHVVRIARAVDRYRHALHARRLGGARPLHRHPSAAGGDRALHPVRPHRSSDLGPVVPQVRLAPDERDLQHTKVGHLLDEVERLRGRQLLGTLASGARPAMTARQIAAEGDFPDGVDRSPRFVDRAHVSGQRKAPLRQRRHGSDRQGARTSAENSHA
jgi:hypothetical protein